MGLKEVKRKGQGDLLFLKTKMFNLLECSFVRIDSIGVLHLEFLNDIIFFFSGNEDKFVNLVKVIVLFCHVLGLKINLSKNCALTIYCAKDKVIALANLLGCEVET